MEKVGVIDFTKICRTCFTVAELNPFDSTYVGNMHVVDLLDKAIGLRVVLGDCLPQQICSKCANELFRIYLFKKQCHNYDQGMRFLLAQLKDVSKDVMDEHDAVEARINAEMEDVTLDQELTVVPHDHSYSKKYEEKIKKKKKPLQSSNNNDVVTIDDSDDDTTFNNSVENTPDEDPLSLSNETVVNNNNKTPVAPKNKRVINKVTKNRLRLNRKYFLKIKNQLTKKPENKQSSEFLSEPTAPPKPVVPKEFKCKVCEEKFDCQVDLTMHRKRMRHNPSQMHTHVCMFCGKLCRPTQLKQHLRTHTKEKPYKCEICGMSFSINSNLRRHKMIHTGERPYLCSLCGAGFIQSTSLRAHEQMHQRNGDTPETVVKRGPLDQLSRQPRQLKFNYRCEVCGRAFKLMSRFQIHMQVHENGHLIKPRKIPNPENRKRNEIDNDNCFLCEFCSKKCKTKHELSTHKYCYHSEKKSVCSTCGKECKNLFQLRKHEETHNTERPHVCTICNKTFKSSLNHNTHMLTHTDLRPLKCPHCPKAFKQMSHLNYHLRIHSGQKPFVCPICNKAFALKGNLTVHLRTHTGETPYVCDICGKGYHDSSNLRRHRQRHPEVKTEVEDEYEEQDQDQEQEQEEEEQVVYEICDQEYVVYADKELTMALEHLE